MPVVQVEMFEGRSLEQKRELVKRMTEVFVEVTHCPPEAVTIILREMSRSHYAEAGVLYSDK